MKRMLSHPTHPSTTPPIRISPWCAGYILPLQISTARVVENRELLAAVGENPSKVIEQCSKHAAATS